MDEPRKYDAKCKKPDTSLCDSMYVKCPERADPETERRLGVVRAWGGGRGIGSNC